MTAAWVSPISSALEDGRARLLAFARAAPADLWDQAAGDGGWRCRDVLAHLAGGNDRLVQTLLESAVNGTPIPPGTFTMDTDAENARGVAERGTWDIARMIAELERDGAETQSLLARLRDDDEGRRWPGFDLTLGQFLAIVRAERHDEHHLAELRAARTHA